MHGGAEEVDLDPCDLYVSLGTLIVEGRQPGLTERGYGEGPHCLPPHGQNRHECDLTSEFCQRQAVLLKHMLLLWRNGIPMSIEVILHPDCCKPANLDSINVEASSNPDTPSCLLEQWNVHMLPKRVPNANTTPRGLILALRSFLHFSQLSAWLSLSGGKSPKNIQYRICVPGEAFSNKFSRPPEMHVFPLANVGKNNAMKVTVRTLPRYVHATLVCSIHDRKEHEITKDFKNMKVEDEMLSKNYKEFIGDNCRSRIDRHHREKVLQLSEKKPSRTSSPADSMIGDSLLDPPQSLQMYPKRYQSPSRSGSPSLEAPERLMLGATSCRKENVRQKSDAYGRHQRRPVVERFLKKEFGGVATSLSPIRYKGIASELKEPELVTKKENNLLHKGKANESSSYFCNTAIASSFPSVEMQFVLERLHQQFSHCNHVPKKQDLYPTAYTQKENLHSPIPNKNIHLQSLKCSSVRNNVCDNPIISSTENKLAKDPNQIYMNGDSSSSTLHFEPLTHKELSNSFEKLTSVLQTCDTSLTSDEIQQACDTIKVLEVGKESEEEACHPEIGSQSMFYFQHDCESLEPDSSSEFVQDSSEMSDDLVLLKDENGIENDENTTSLSTKEHKEDDDQKDTKMNQKLTYSKTWSEGLSQLRIKATIAKSNHFLKHFFSEAQNSSSLPDNQKETRKCKGNNVPSAEAKAKFRRSLDSATSLVFYKSSGLPLTSSPAPIRKSGTCFDFDSSLTSVSAIKRALFEKNSEDDDQKNILSTSAPPSTTTSSLLCNFEESVLNGCLEPVSTVEGFTAEIGASGSFCPRHRTLPVTVFFYTLEGTDKVISPYLGHIGLGRKGYHVPKQGTVQVTLFNPHQTVVKMFVVRYNLSDMPPHCQTFLRQRTLHMPVGASQDDSEARKWLRYLIHLRFASSKSGRIYLHTDVRLIIFRKSDVDAATVHEDKPYELRSFIQEPLNPKFSPRK
ncbi:protein FAM214A-like isoform X2 [Limulus polyphemus]|nr:protein FAM214A-like isoform X2 [Limulus polyphemus]